MPSMYDVAELAGVSAKTVSRYLNDATTLRIPTRRAIAEAMDKLGYIPDATARALRTSRTATIGLVVSNLRATAIIDTLAGIEEAVHEHGYSLLLADSQGKADIEAANIRTLLERRVEGLILFPHGTDSAPMEEVVRAGVPALLMHAYPTRAYPGIPNLPILSTSGMPDVLHYLAALRHRRVATVAWGVPDIESRFKGYRRQFESAGLETDESLLVLAGAGPDCSGPVAALFTNPDRPTAVIADIALAPDAILGLRRAGMRIPRDVSFVCMGDSRWALAYDPPLTVVARDSLKRGRQAAEYIFARIAGKNTEHLLEGTSTELIVRESCAEAATTR